MDRTNQIPRLEEYARVYQTFPILKSELRLCRDSLIQ